MPSGFHSSVLAAAKLEEQRKREILLIVVRGYSRNETPRMFASRLYNCRVKERRKHFFRTEGSFLARPSPIRKRRKRALTLGDPLSRLRRGIPSRGRYGGCLATEAKKGEIRARALSEISRDKSHSRLDSYQKSGEYILPG